MIIQVRGTSGSGKTWVMRRVMDLMGDWHGVTVEGRKRPLYYYSCSEWPATVVLGHYEIDCGGCDTIGSAPKVFDTIRTVVPDPSGSHVLSEGLLWSEDVRWTLELVRFKYDVRAIFLITEPETCLTQVVRRQAGREPIDSIRVRRKLETRVGTIDRARERLTAAGVYCRRASAAQAPGIILNWLRQAAR